GFARVRFINLCPDSIAMDLKATRIDTLLASNKKFKQNSAFGNIATDDQSNYTLNILNHESGSSLLTTEFKPKQGQYYTIVATGFMDTEVETQKLRVYIFKHD